MEDKQWGIFGFIPDNHYNWFLNESGTYFKDGRWRIKKDVQEEREIKKQGRIVGKHNQYKTNNFQSDYSRAKEQIVSSLEGKGEYIVGNQEIFDLMRYGKCVVEYEYQGQMYKENIEV